MADGGILVLPLTIGTTQFSVAFEKRNDTLRSRSIVPCGFMPLRGSMAGESTGSISVSSAPGLMLTLVNAVRERADAVAALLQTPPASAAFPSRQRNWWSAVGFAISGTHGALFAAGLRSDNARYGFTGHAAGLFAADVTSGCILSFGEIRDEVASVALQSYGTPAAMNWLFATLAAWEEHGAPPPGAYQIMALKQPSTTAPPGALIVDLPHWRLIIEQHPS
jgi:hypothetical protein